jgi:hypothetical protein
MQVQSQASLHDENPSLDDAVMCMNMMVHIAKVMYSLLGSNRAAWAVAVHDQE